MDTAFGIEARNTQSPKGMATIATAISSFRDRISIALDGVREVADEIYGPEPTPSKQCANSPDGPGWDGKLTALTLETDSLLSALDEQIGRIKRLA